MAKKVKNRKLKKLSEHPEVEAARINAKGVIVAAIISGIFLIISSYIKGK